MHAKRPLWPPYDHHACQLRPSQACQSPGGPSTSVIVSDIPGTTVGTLLEFAERRPYLFPKALLRAMQKAVSGGDAAVSGGSLMLTGASMGAGGKPPKGVQVG